MTKKVYEGPPFGRLRNSQDKFGVSHAGSSGVEVTVYFWMGPVCAGLFAGGVHVTVIFPSPATACTFPGGTGYAQHGVAGPAF